MKTGFSRIAALLIAAALLLALAACGSGADKIDGGGQTSTGSGQQIEQNEQKPEDYIISMYVQDPRGSTGIQDNDIANAIYEKTGVKMDIQWATTDDLTTQIALHVAGGDLYELYQGVDDFDVLFDADQAVELLPLFEQHAPNIMKKIGRYFDFWAKSIKQKKLLYIRNLTVPDEALKISTDVFGGLMIRYDLLEEMGFPKLETTTDWYNVLKEMMKKWPVTDDGQSTIGFGTNLKEDWAWDWSFMNPFHSGNGIYCRGTYYYTDDGVPIIPGSREDTTFFWPGVKFFNNMYREGLLDPAAFETDYDMLVEKTKAGRVLSFVVPWFVEDSEIEKIWHEQGKDQAYVLLNLKADGYTGKTLWSYSSVESIGRSLLAITKAAKDPVRIVKFLDFLMSDEGQLLTGRGIEGKHYTRDGNKIVMTPEFYELSKEPEFHKTYGFTYDFVQQRGIAPGTVDQPTFFKDDIASIRDIYPPNVIKGLDHYGHAFRGQDQMKDLKDLSFMMFVDLMNPLEDDWGDKIELSRQEPKIKLDGLKVKLIKAKTDEEFESLKKEYIDTIENTEYYKVFREILSRKWKEYEPEINKIKASMKE